MKQQENGRRYVKLLIPLAVLAAGVMVLGLAAEGPVRALEGMKSILFQQDTLYTDYFASAGPGAALFNAGLMCLLTLAILYFAGDPVNGFTLVSVGLMAGFSLFGKNPVNSAPIVLGAALYALFKREHFSKYASVALLATALSPMVSYLAFHPERPMPLMGVLTGLLIGFLLPPLAAYTFRIQNGMSLYNAGFACGILGMVLVPILSAMGHSPEARSYWSEDYTFPLGAGLVALCVLLILLGTLHGGKKAWRRYGHILRTSGRLPSDYLRTFGLAPVMINMGINGLLGLGYLTAVGGDVNGPTAGALIVVMGFSAYGKHARNIFPIMAGVFLGNFVNSVPLDNPTMQIAGLFGTTLAPISGVFGWPWGVLAGLLHSSVVLYCGTPVGGLNLYNNGFSGGIIAIVLYPILMSLVRHRRPALQDEEFFDIFEDDHPIDEKELDAHRGDEGDDESVAHHGSFHGHGQDRQE